MNLLKRIIRKAFSTMGYEIRRKQVGQRTDPKDLEVYHKHYPHASIVNQRFYNIGAGTFRHPYWKNIDLASEWYAQSQVESDMINYDLFSLEPLPLPDNCAEVVYTSHTVEHVNDQAAQNMFRESYRILKKGGIFRLTTPDVDLYYKAYRNNDRDFYWWIELYSTREVTEKIGIYPFDQCSLAQVFLFSFATHTSQCVIDTTVDKFSDEDIEVAFSVMAYEEALEHFIARCTLEAQRRFPGYHMNWWNWKKAERMLREAGFIEIYKSGYGQSVSPVMRNTQLFDKQDPKDSLYVEAVK